MESRGYWGWGESGLESFHLIGTILVLDDEKVLEIGSACWWLHHIVNIMNAIESYI